MLEEDRGRVLSFPIFQKGQIIVHAYYHYKGVIFQIDSHFKGSEEWYEFMTRGNPSKNSPWYHILVNDCVHTTYVPQEYIKRLNEYVPINHPLLSKYFNQYHDGRYALFL